MGRNRNGKGRGKGEPSLEAIFQESVQRHRAGDLNGAAQGYARILERSPDHADTLHLMGLAHFQRGGLAEAENHLARAVMLQPEVGLYLGNLARVVQARGRPEEAERLWRNVLLKDPEHGEALLSVSALLLERGVSDEARVLLLKAAGLNLAEPTLLNTLGVLLKRVGCPDEAEGVLRRVLELRPGHAEGWNNLGNLLREQNRWDEARRAFDKAAELAPTLAEVHGNLGQLLQEMRLFHDAAQAFARAGACQPRAEVWPVWAANASFMAGEVMTGIEWLEGYLARVGENNGVMASSCRLWLRNYVEEDGHRLAMEHRAWGTLQVCQEAPSMPAPAAPSRPWRVGLLSPDFREHSVGRFLRPLMEQADSSRLAFHGYGCSPVQDGWTERFQSLCAGWRFIDGLDDTSAALRMREDDLDLLLDLTGHVIYNRLGVLRHRPAPVLGTWLGYPGTTGLSCVDYRLTDGVADPPGSEAHYTETLWRMSRPFFCFMPPEVAPEPGPLPLEGAGRLTFGWFGSLAKVTDAVLDQWAQVLGSFPDARMLLQSPAFHEGETLTRVRGRFEARGIDAARLEIFGAMPFQEHLALHQRVDLILDTAPWNGHTTTCHALWMGVPVVVPSGQRHAARMGRSILTALGLAELAPEGGAAFVATACALARDPPRLNRLRATLRTTMAGSVLTDAPGFAVSFEEAVAGMLARRGDAPGSVS